MVAHIVSDHDLMLFHAHGQNLLLREGDGFVGGAHEAGDAADVPHQMPGIVSHDHLDQHVAGEYLPFHLFGGARVRDLCHRLHGDLDPQDHVLHSAACDELFNTGLNGVLVAGIGMHHIPLRAL